jgi:hypothetical protein
LYILHSSHPKPELWICINNSAFKYYVRFHKLVKYAVPYDTTKQAKPIGEGKMKSQTAPQQRKKLEQKILKALAIEMRTLRKPFQRMLADDLVTAFENRISVIQAYQQKTSQKRG